MCDEVRGPRSRALHDMAISLEAAIAIVAAYNVVGAERDGRDPYFNERLEKAQVQYKHGLRRLKDAYPGEFCGFSEQSAKEMVYWTIDFESLGFSIPAAAAAARNIGFDLEKAAEAEA